MASTLAGSGCGERALNGRRCGWSGAGHAIRSGFHRGSLGTLGEQGITGLVGHQHPGTG